ncbi:MAG: AAA family ATPase, partial [Dysgonamonadaceae bacterium]|jgi:KaiC/GvpD/RAD55 family RecA-like ATPase|nr:AAA family ATPase [Dysgonamonadaceae bacterium]
MERLTEQPQSQAGLFRVRTANQCLEDAKAQPIPRNMYQFLIFEGEITFLFADTGIGKSIFAVQIANEISKTEKVLYLDLELSDKQFQNRYSENYQDEYKFSENLIRPDFARPFKVPDGCNYDDYFIESLKRLIDCSAAKIIIIDNMTKLISSDTDSARNTKPLMDLLCDLKFEYGLTMLLLEHTRKTDMSRPISLNDLQGSKMKSNFADAAFSIGRSAKDKNLRYIKQLKCRSSEVNYDSDNVPVYEIIKENSFLQFKFVNYDTEFNHLKQPNENEKSDLICKVKELSQAGRTQRDIAKELGISLGAVNKYSKK